MSCLRGRSEQLTGCDSIGFYQEIRLQAQALDGTQQHSPSAGACYSPLA